MKVFLLWVRRVLWSPWAAAWLVMLAALMVYVAVVSCVLGAIMWVAKGTLDREWFYMVAWCRDMMGKVVGSCPQEPLR